MRDSDGSVGCDLGIACESQWVKSEQEAKRAGWKVERGSSTEYICPDCLRAENGQSTGDAPSLPA
ncbi:MAG: hypothetical protein ACLQQB_03285 [Solirubrobacteraceae bacterium]